MDRDHAIPLCPIPAPDGGRATARWVVLLERFATHRAQAEDAARIRQAKRELTGGAD